jgi:hypothetical protein
MVIKQKDSMQFRVWACNMSTTKHVIPDSDRGTKYGFLATNIIGSL